MKKFIYKILVHFAHTIISSSLAYSIVCLASSVAGMVSSAAFSSLAKWKKLSDPTFQFNCNQEGRMNHLSDFGVEGYSKKKYHIMKEIENEDSGAFLCIGSRSL